MKHTGNAAAMAKKKQDYMAQADRWFSRYIRARDRKCLSCGRTSSLQCAHIHSRSYKVIRCDPDNAVTLCKSCHVRYTHRPLEWEDWVEDRWPGKWRRLKKLALTHERQDWKFQAAYWKEMAEKEEAA